MNEPTVEERTPIINKCEGCGRVDGNFCKAYLYPDKKWRLGNCNFATHMKTETEKKGKIRIGQQKGKKKSRRMGTG